MQNKPYFCPDCRSNRIKFAVLTQYSQRFLKDAVSGEIGEMSEAELIAESEPIIQCMVCSFAGNEMRFIKQAEREPRSMTPTMPSYM